MNTANKSLNNIDALKIIMNGPELLLLNKNPQKRHFTQFYVRHRHVTCSAYCI